MANRNCMSLWFPAVVESGVPCPRTELIRTDAQLINLVDGVTPDGFDVLVDMLQVGGNRLGWPAFLRSGQTSGKHDWVNTCYVSGPDDIAQHVYNIVEFSACADLFGLPTDVWVIREMLKVTPAFHAFEGMPVTRERRYFVEDGKVLGHHPYWPPEAMSFGVDVDDPEERLKPLNYEGELEVEWLTAESERVSRQIEGAWSVDWLNARGVDGMPRWYCIDMARAEDSWVWRGHPTAPKAFV